MNMSDLTILILKFLLENCSFVFPEALNAGDVFFGAMAQ